jgi:heat-inducible transcriptional repressor
MTAHDIAEINNLMKIKMAELDQILTTASKVASNLTNYTGFAIKPKASSVNITRFETLYIDKHSFVLVMLLSSGAVKTKNVRLETSVSSETVANLGEALNFCLGGRSAEEITLPIIMKLEALMGPDSAVVSPTIKCIYDVMSEMDHGELKFSGIGRLLQYPEYSDKEKLGEILSTFEQKEDLLDLVSKNTDDELGVFIGSESSVKVMDQSTIVFKHIKKNGRTVGAVGVIGPRRMDYAKVLATLESIGGNISNIIGDPKELSDGTKNENGDK